MLAVRSGHTNPDPQSVDWEHIGKQVRAGRSFKTHNFAQGRGPRMADTITQWTMDRLVELHVCRRSDPLALQGQSGEVPEQMALSQATRYTAKPVITFRFNFVITLSVAIKYCCT